MQIFIGGSFIGGATELLTLIDSGILKQRLASTNRAAFPEGIAALIAQHTAADVADKVMGPSPQETQAAELAAELASSVNWVEKIVGCVGLLAAHCVFACNRSVLKCLTPCVAEVVARFGSICGKVSSCVQQDASEFDIYYCYYYYCCYYY
jgi:hypothetical protein